MPTFAELLVKIGGDATGFTSAMDGIASKTDATVKATEAKLGGLAGAFKSIGAKLGAGLGFAALGAGILATAEKFEQASFTLRRATGATGADLAALEKSFTSIYSTSARSAEEISGALSSIKVETKLTGAALEDLTKSNLAFAKVTGTDVKTAIESTQQVFKNWNIAAKDQTAALDILYRVIQETKISSGALTAQMAFAGPIVRTLGLTFMETAALVGNMEEKGLNAEKVFSALNIGFKKLAKDSADPKKALFDLIEKMKGIEDQTKAAALAAPIFGRGALVLADAVKKGAMDVGEFTEILSKNTDTVRAAAAETEGFRAQMVKFQHQVESVVSAHKDLILGLGAVSLAWTAFGSGIAAVAVKLTALAVANPLVLFAVAAAGAIYVTVKALDDLEKKYDSFEKRQKGQKEFLPGQKPEEQFTVFQGQDVSGGLGIKFLKESAVAVESYEEAIKRLKEEQKRLNEVADNAKLIYESVARAYGNGTATARQLADAHLRLTLAQNAASPEKLIEWHKKQSEGYAKWAVRLDKVKQSTFEANLQWLIFQEDIESGEIDKQLMRISATSEELGKNLSKLKFPEDLIPKDLNRQTDELSEAFKTVGIDTEKTGEKVRAAYERIKASGIATPHEILVAERAALAAWIKDEEAAGNAVSEAQRERLAKLDRMLAIHVKGWKDKWQETLRGLKSAFDSFNRDLAGIFISLFTGDKRNDAIKKEEAALQASLVTRAAEWEAYQKSITDQIVAMRQKYADELSKEEADLAASLAERESEYTQSATDTEAALTVARADNAKGLAEDLAQLVASLDERRVEYEQYVADIGDKLQQTRADHAASLAGTLQDLRDALDDKRRTYDLYVEDVNQSLGRIHEDYAESIDDQTKATKRGIAEKQKDFKRDEQDTLERIRRLKATGKTEQDAEIQDLRLSLSRKAEDLAQYIQQENADLEEFTSDAQRRLKREEADLKESLKERTDEYQRYIAENTAKRQEAVNKNAADLAKDEAALAKSLAERTAAWVAYQADNEGKAAATIAKYAESLAKEEAALQASLAKKLAELEKYRAEAAAKLETMRADYAAKMDNEEADLHASLAERLKEYDQFRADTAAKLEELRQEFQSVWDKIGAAFGNMFANMGVSVTKFIIEEIEGKLVKALTTGSLVDAIKGLERSISGIFSGLGGGGVDQTDSGLGDEVTRNIPAAGQGAGTGSGSGGSGGGGGSSLVTAALAGFTLGYDLGKDIKYGSTQENTFNTSVFVKDVWNQLVAFAPAIGLIEVHAAASRSCLVAIEREISKVSSKLLGTAEGSLSAINDALGRGSSIIYELQLIKGECTNAAKDIFTLVHEQMGILLADTAAMRGQLAIIPGTIKSESARMAGAATDAKQSATVETVETGSGYNLADLISAAAAGAKVARPTGASVEELQLLLKAQERALANAVKGFDPHNPLGAKAFAERDRLAKVIADLETAHQPVSNEQRASLKSLFESQLVTTQEAFLRNSGAAYQEWLRGAMQNTKDQLAQWRAWAAAAKAASDLAAALMDIQSSMVPGFRNPATGIPNVPIIPSSGPRFADSYQAPDPGSQRWPSMLRATIQVMLDGRQIGDAQVQNLALMGVSM